MTHAVFNTKTLRFEIDGHDYGPGYSGHGEGLNNWAMEAVSNIGPLPKGKYTVGAAFDSPSKGPVVFRLTPLGHNAHGRTDFEAHGDNAAMNHTASNGCLILCHNIRVAIRDLKVDTLEVI